MQNQRKRTREHYIHRLSYTAQERIAGSFVLIAVGLLVWLLITSQKTQNLFEEQITLYGTMTDIQAVDTDTNVIISGLNVGTVTDVNIDDKNHVVISMSILKKYQKLIRTDSVAELLNFKFALLGKSVIEISIGSPSLPVIEDGSTLVIKESLNLVKLLSRFEPTLVTIEQSISKIDTILEAVDPQQVNTNIDNLAVITDDLKAITSQVEQGKGLAGSVVFDEGLQGDVLSSTTNLRQITEQTMQLLTQTQALLRKVETQVDEIPELTDKVKPLLYEADRTIRATQQIWPLSSSIPEQDTQTLISPEATE
jgi:ABC-type transporter Mla subunit MlaD